MANQMIFFLILTSLAFVVVLGRSFDSQQTMTITKIINKQRFKCVDFYMQPAFSNSSLNLQDVQNITKLQQLKSVSGLGLKDQGCPIGTVPILDRSQHEGDELDFLKSYRFSRLEAGSHCSGRVQTRPTNPNKKFFGANAHINIFKPYVQSSQWSSARIKLLNGAESIEAGWMVNPNAFKDNEAHLYASFNAGGKRCINMDCPGFVQVSTNIPLGVATPVYSVIGGQQFGWNISIDKHQDDGHWWLSIIAKEKYQIGYWPKSLFTILANVANQVEFGGEVDNPGERSPFPQMGNGHMAAYDTERSSCFVHATVVDESFHSVNPPETEKYSDCNLDYSVLDGGYHDDPNLGRLIFYGGPLAQKI